MDAPSLEPQVLSHLSTAMIAIGIDSAQPRPYITWANNSAEQLLGKTKDELLSRPVSECLGSVDDTWFQLCETCFSQTSSQNFSIPSAEGDYTWIGEIFALDEGRWGIFFREGSALTTAQSAWQREHEFRTKTMDLIPMGVIICDSEGRMVYANPWIQKTFSVSASRIGAERLDVGEFRFAHGKTGHALGSAYFLAAARAEQGVSIINVKQRQDDQIRVFDIRFAYVKAADRARDALILAVEDRSDLAARDEQLLESLVDQHELTREVQHRVKNTIGLIQSLVELERQYLVEEQVQHSDGQAVDSLVHALGELQGRIHALGLVFSLVYQSDSTSRVPFDSCLKEIVLKLPTLYSGGNLGNPFLEAQQKGKQILFGELGLPRIVIEGAIGMLPLEMAKTLSSLLVEMLVDSFSRFIVAESRVAKSKKARSSNGLASENFAHSAQITVQIGIDETRGFVEVFEDKFPPSEEVAESLNKRIGASLRDLLYATFLRDLQGVVTNGPNSRRVEFPAPRIPTKK